MKAQDDEENLLDAAVGDIGRWHGPPSAHAVPETVFQAASGPAYQDEAADDTGLRGLQLPPPVDVYARTALQESSQELWSANFLLHTAR